jgi:hypothetical protein
VAMTVSELKMMTVKVKRIIWIWRDCSHSKGG